MSQDQDNVQELREILARLKLQDFEEDIRESDNRQFLRD
jgi:hypothetical protein